MSIVVIDSSDEQRTNLGHVETRRQYQCRAHHQHRIQRHIQPIDVIQRKKAKQIVSRLQQRRSWPY